MYDAVKNKLNQEHSHLRDVKVDKLEETIGEKVGPHQANGQICP